ncbi:MULTISPECIES: ATPase [Protofrankia]|uniref:ATPase n=1 Tax=Protofrankia coriariae TaxID=1562887 RepID=A0ABR5F0T0_9ACTN|nr:MULTISPECIES: ATPase [Protofrankia]KLL10314.1 ATPase [Protofrankia coriariae]ONH34514.1 ATPase [Protofrankia sp. BMG5.30]
MSNEQPNQSGRKFAIERETLLPTTPEEYWDAVTTGNAGWLWPTQAPQPQVGGSWDGGTLLAWEPPHHLIVRSEGPDGWFNQLEHLVEARDGGTTWVRYVHSGVFADDWDNQYDGASRHTDFYLHTLGQYLRYFSRRPASYVSVDAPASSITPDGFDALRRALGLGAAGQGDQVRVTLPGLRPLDAAVDYLAPHFLGLRTEDALYRVFGRNAFGAPVSVAAHLFASDADQQGTEKALQAWLEEVYA